MIALSVIGLLAVLFCLPVVFVKTYRCTPWTEALSGAKMVHLALMEFDREFGALPNNETAPAVLAAIDTDYSLGSVTSNDFFRQLLAAGYGNEKMCYVRITGSKRADGVMDKVHALEKGECGFSYIPGCKGSSNPRFPVIVSPLLPGTDRVDTTVFKGKALLVTLDGEVTEAAIDRKGHVIVFGKRLLDPANPIWEGRSPVIAWPE